MEVMQTGLRSTQSIPTPKQAYSHTDNLNTHAVVISSLQMQSYPIVSMVQPEMYKPKKKSSLISTHRRSLVSLGFLLMLGLSLLGTSTLGGGTTLQHIIQSITLLS